jgi:AbrB family looped-hinge helix DNA binding protein
MELGKVTSKGQTTIPKAIREKCGIRPGDVLAFEVEGERVVLRKVRSEDADYLRGLEETLEEWLSPEDEAAYRDL